MSKNDDKNIIKHSGGRPTKYKREYCLVVEYMARTGLIEEEIAELIGISKATITIWKNKYPEFLASLKRGKNVSDDMVEKSLFNRAIGLKIKEVYSDEADGCKRTRTVIKEIPPDTTSMIFWLKNRRPEKWRDKHNIHHEITSNSGVIILSEKISLEEWKKKYDERHC